MGRMHGDVRAVERFPALDPELAMPPAQHPELDPTTRVPGRAVPAPREAAS
jgi:hypothetical protein